MGNVISPTPTLTSTSQASVVPRYAMEHLGPFGIRPCNNFQSFKLNTHKDGLEEYIVLYKEKTYSGQLSPKSLITLPAELKVMAKIHADATHFVWGYPSPQWSLNNVPETSEEKFLSYGGYVYLMVDNIVGINAIENEGGQDLLFKGPYIFDDFQKIEKLKQSNRLQEVTIPSLKAKGVQKYCWLIPGESHSDNKSVITTHGAFMYLHDDGPFFFKVKGSLKTEQEIQENTIIWEWSDKQDQWITYDTKSVHILEEAFLTDKPTATIIHLQFVDHTSEVQYDVNLNSNTPIYSCTLPGRKVRRITYGSTSKDAKWAYSMQRNLSDIWVDFFEQSNTLTDQEYLKALRDNRPCTINITIDKKETLYQLDFEKMIQTNKNTGHTRYIRRCTVGKLMNKPTPTLFKKKKVRQLRNSLTSIPCYGDITIQIKAAKDLAKINKFGCDPVVVVTTNFSSFFWKSTTRMMTTTPEWNQSSMKIKVACDSVEGRVVIFTFYHHRLVQKNLYLGRMSISLFDIMEIKNMSGWRQLDYECREKDPNADPASVEFSISFTPGPPPVNKNINMDNLMPNGGEIISFEDPNIMEGLKSRYRLQPDILGQGSFAVVKKGINIQDQSLVAVKIINKSVREDYIDQIVCEIKIMAMMSNNYCVSIVDSRHTAQEIYIAMEFCSGGDMFDALISGRLVGEDAIKIPIRHILLGLQYLHQNCICHRDIKPENILLHKDKDKETWKIADFGISTFFTEENPKIEGKEGTLQYMAPEIFIDGTTYTKTVDIWATGVVCYVALTKRMPWPGSTELEIEESIATYTPGFDEDRISVEAKDFVYSLLNKDPSKRRIENALKHNWM